MGLRHMSQHLLEDYLDIDVFASQEVKRHPRTVKRWTDEPDGLPYTTLGNRILIHIPTAREWLFARMRNPNPLSPKKKASRSRT
jgi:hypothetical protein